MGDGNARGEAGQGRTQCARGVTLNDQEVGRGTKQRLQGSRNRGDMGVRVFLAGTMEGDPFKFAQPKVGRVEIRMLASEDQRRRKAVRGEGTGNRLELDSFGPGPDDQPDVRGTQPSP